MSADASVEPVPENMEGEFAGFATRMAAFLIDIVIINLSTLFVSAVIWLVFDFFDNALAIFVNQPLPYFSTVSTWITAAISFTTLLVMVWLYPTFFWMLNGQTIGKRIMGLRVVRMDGKKMTLVKGLVRVLGYLIGAIPILLGFIWVLFSNERRGWHDYLAGTCVIYSWEAKSSDALKTRLMRTKQQLVEKRQDDAQRTPN